MVFTTKYCQPNLVLTNHKIDLVAKFGCDNQTLNKVQNLPNILVGITKFWVNSIEHFIFSKSASASQNHFDHWRIRQLVATVCMSCNTCTIFINLLIVLCKHILLLFTTWQLNRIILLRSVDTTVPLSFVLTRSSADADKPARHILRSVKVTKHSTIPYVRYIFLLCNSNFKTCRFSDIRLHKMSWPWNPDQRLLKVVP